MTARKNSFQAKIRHSSAVAARPGVTRGNTTEARARRKPAPST